MIKKFKKKNSELIYDSIFNLTEELLTETDSTCLSRHVFNFLPSGKIIDLKIKNNNKFLISIAVSDDREQVSIKTKDDGTVVKMETMDIPKEDTEEFKKIERKIIDTILEVICDMVG